MSPSLFLGFMRPSARFVFRNSSQSASGWPNAGAGLYFFAEHLWIYFGHASRSPSTFAWQSAYILTVSVAQASTSRPVTPVSRSRPGQLESKFAGIGIAGDLCVEDAQAVSIKARLQVHRALHDLFQGDRDGAVFGFIG